MISWRKHYKSGVLAVSFLLATSVSAHAQTAPADSAKTAMTATATTGDPVKGETLFKQTCAACHKLDSKLIGPALGGIVEKLQTEQGLGVDWLHKWIRNNEKLRASGDKYANQIYEENGQLPMTTFEQFSDQDIDDILAYTTNPPKAAPAVPAKTPEQIAEEQALAQQEKNNRIVKLVSVGVIAALLLLLVFSIRKVLKLQNTQEISALDKTRIHSFGEWYSRNRLAGNIVFCVLAFAFSYLVWNWLMGIGVYKGYAPEQPIYFSHKIHAGDNGIDCQLCHSGAKYGKVSEIPSTNVCMNCHKLINQYNGKYVENGKSAEFYTGEIKKIYASAGWDETSQTYSKPQQPIAWTRIHNMQDFVYFNHSQHVVAGEQAIMKAKNVTTVCFACHGDVNTMDKVSMANDFTMGWCIDCHRTTEVDMTNQYNAQYYKDLHEKLKKQYGSDKITVDAIGGLECGKCHY